MVDMNLMRLLNLVVVGRDYPPVRSNNTVPPIPTPDRHGCISDSDVQPGERNRRERSTGKNYFYSTPPSRYCSAQDNILTPIHKSCYVGG